MYCLNACYSGAIYVYSCAACQAPYAAFNPNSPRYDTSQNPPISSEHDLAMTSLLRDLTSQVKIFRTCVKLIMERVMTALSRSYAFYTSYLRKTMGVRLTPLRVRGLSNVHCTYNVSYRQVVTNARSTQCQDKVSNISSNGPIHCHTSVV